VGTEELRSLASYGTLTTGHRAMESFVMSREDAEYRNESVETENQRETG